ncbi:MAG: hypothetical protein M1832_001537 [Thelocarpon impressellum]|nr:MAG: hypothetical protein M1832_001537 [Thelocarpon impressellum]
MPAMPHVALLVFLLALVIPGLPHSTKAGRFVYNGVQAGALGTRSAHGQAGQLVGRADSPTDVCVRFSHQSAIVNGTLYVYGGQAKKDANQISDTWNNNLVSLPLDKNFEIGTPTLKGLAQPSGPPPVANGFLWNSYTSLFLYGGLFSDKPAASPLPFSMWEYDIAASSWKEHEDPKTSAGNNSAPEGVPIQRAAEGAGLNVPQLGRGWYFGGHLDGYTTEGWSQSIPRVYLKSFVEYTFPGFTNDGVKALAGGKRAPAEGTWRNITEGGLQDAAGFTERADGVLAYVPGWGRDGIILGLAGGTNATFVSSALDARSPQPAM